MLRGSAVFASAVLLAACAALAAPPLPPPSPADAFARLVADAKRTVPHVRDYTATLVKRERVGGKLLDEESAALKARAKPFSVHLKFDAPAAAAGKEACFVTDKHQGKMRAKCNGLLAAVGFVTIALDDSRAMATNRHTVAEAGIVHLVERVADLDTKGATVRVAEYSFDGRPCTRAELTYPERHPGAYAPVCVTYFDAETRLPVRFEAYDRPAPGESAPRLLECYSYLRIKYNVGLTDADFDY